MQGEALRTLYANEERVHGNSQICRVPLRPTTAPWVKAGREKEKVSIVGNRGSAFANVPFNFPLRRTWASGRRAAYVCLKAQMARLPSISKAGRRTLKVILFFVLVFFFL